MNLYHDEKLILAVDQDDLVSRVNQMIYDHQWLSTMVNHG